MSFIIHGLVYDRRMAGRPKANLELTETQRQELEGMGGLAELARSGRTERIKPSLKGRILSEAVRPPEGVGRWSTRSMAKHVGVSKATVQRVWSTNDIKPHRT